MAAFYTYRHVELDRVGCGKRKVLKPPGGGSSDIFGTSDESNKQTHNSKKYVGSQLAMSHPEDETSNPADRKMSAASLDAADGASVSSQTSSTSNGTPDNSEPNTPRSGNPVTGIGYDPEAEKKEETPRRQRVPPGGFSSKLW